MQNVARKFLPVFTGLFVLFTLVSCEEELVTIGGTVIGGDPFRTDKAEFDVFAYNRDILAVQTNKLPLYQLGVYDDPVYGKVTASITSQLGLENGAGNPIFGNFSQSTEDNSDTDSNESTINENETVTEVLLYIPFLQNQSGDRDLDGVPDEFDADPDDPNSDSDGDGLTDNAERVAGSDPLNVDTDGDGINDADDTETLANRFPKKVDLDSIYGNRQAAFNLKVERSTFFLRDLDPNSNFQNAQEYYNTQEFAPGFVSDLLFEGEVTISDEEILIFEEDDPDTEEDESLQNPERIQPGIRVALDPDFFQTNILDKEGQAELLSLTNFREFLRGIHISSTFPTDELLILFDLRQATITIDYTFDRVDEGEVIQSERTYTLSLITGGNQQPIQGNAVNTLIHDPLPTSIGDNLDTDQNTSRIYLQGGGGSYAEIKLFDEDNGREIIEEIKANNWIINEAKLVFYVDRELLDASGATEEPVRLYLFNGETNDPIFNSLNESSIADTAFGLFLDYDGFLEEEDGKGIKYTVRITDHINDLVVRDEDNVTLGLMLTPDIRIGDAVNTMVAGNEETDLPNGATISPLSTVLIGSNVPANDSKRLKLEIFYTETD